MEVEKSKQKLPFTQEFGWVSRFGSIFHSSYWFSHLAEYFVLPHILPTKVVNARVLAFFSLLFCFGVEWGTEQTFYFVYANEELGATISLLGIMGMANPVTSLIM